MSDNGLEHRPDIGRRAQYNAQDLARRALAGSRFITLQPQRGYGLPQINLRVVGHRLGLSPPSHATIPFCPLSCQQECKIVVGPRG